MRKTVITIAFFAVASLGVFFLGRHSGGERYITKIRTDTLIVYDTVRMVDPVPVYVRTTDTMYVAIGMRDTLTIRDTLYVSLPREERTYRDTLYAARVSGYRPNLDWIEVYPRTVYVNRNTETTRKYGRWGVGVSAGYGFGLHDKTVTATPYIGIGVSYHLFRW